MADIVKMKLSNNKELIIELLEKYGFCNFSGSEYLSFAFDNESTGSCKLNIETLHFNRWSTGDSGDIITAIMLKTGLSFKEALSELRCYLGISDEMCSMTKVDVKKQSELFCGLLCNMEELRGEKIYTAREVDRFEPIISTVFRQDGINIFTQHEFDIRYDKNTDRIVILWKDLQGNVVGCNARSNYDFSDDYKYKYISLLQFHKSNFLYGLYENQHNIRNDGIAFIFEAEKSVLQCASFNMRNAVSLGCSTIKKEQAMLLKDCNTKKIVLAFDEGIEYLHYVNTASKIKEWLENVEIYMLYDKNNEYLERGSKNSPVDLGENVFNELLKKCLTKLM
jgi:DNA primase